MLTFNNFAKRQLIRSDDANNNKLAPHYCLYSTVDMVYMSEYFDRYFPTDNIADYDWIRNPFSCQFTDLIGKEEEQLAELSSDRSLELKLQDKHRQRFGATLGTNVRFWLRESIDCAGPICNCLPVRSIVLLRICCGEIYV